MGVETSWNLVEKPGLVLRGFQNVWRTCWVVMDILVELLHAVVGHGKIILWLGMACTARGSRGRGWNSLRMLWIMDKNLVNMCTEFKGILRF